MQCVRDRFPDDATLLDTGLPWAASYQNQTRDTGHDAPGRDGQATLPEAAAPDCCQQQHGDQPSGIGLDGQVDQVEHQPCLSNQVGGIHVVPRLFGADLRFGTL